MKRIILVTILLLCSSSFVLAEQPDWQGVETALGRKGAVQEDMFKVTFPRSDLKVMVGEIPVEPGLALTSWIGFKGSEKSAMMMGDLVLLEKEVSPVMAQLVAKGIEVTALHNHLLNESPTVKYLHFSGNGDPRKLAEAMRSALSLTGTPIEMQQPATTRTTTVDWTKVETIFGKTGQKKGNLLQLSFPRQETIKEHGMDVPPFLGMATGINMQAVGNKAATTGDFVLLGDEVNPVVQALTSHNIAVTALHSHMLHESPRLFFLHFWGYDEPEKLASGLKAALDKTNSKK
jgi:Domain of Unknown Function (DUF1259)